ncbi:MAG: NAD(P)(+) transhydrogenase (Re/Si-specific) subunit beta [Planctomycetota bacterium]
MIQDLIFILQLVAAGFFIYGIKKMSKVSTSRQGNQYAMIAMGLGIVAALMFVGIEDFGEQRTMSQAEYDTWKADFQTQTDTAVAAKATPPERPRHTEKTVGEGDNAKTIHTLTFVTEGYTGIMIVFIILGVGLGAGAGWVTAKRVPMTAMPQMVALFNGFGGIASALVAFAVFFFAWGDLSNHATMVGEGANKAAQASTLLANAANTMNADDLDKAGKAITDADSAMRDLLFATVSGKEDAAMVTEKMKQWRDIPHINRDSNKETVATAQRTLNVAISGGPSGTMSGMKHGPNSGWRGGADATFIFFLSVLIGVLTFSGSLVAFAKLQEIKIAGRWLSDAITLPGGQMATVGMLAGSVVLILLGGFVFSGPEGVFFILLLLTLVSLALGVYLTMPIGGADMPVVISLLNSYSGIAAAMAGFVVGNYLLIVGGALVGSAGLILTQIMCKAMNRSLWNVIKGGVGGAPAKDARDYTNIKPASPEDMAIDLINSESVIIVPGYGLAVSQAQHQTKELVGLLEAKGVDVKFAIHPVAGRMPGHMNVLLAEADIDYDKLLEMDEINSDFKNTDICVILGANDVVNPAALTDETSPLYGMPILNCHEARQVYMIKRSTAPGYAGVKNPLFDYDNCRMVFADGKQALVEAIEAIKSEG